MRKRVFITLLASSLLVIILSLSFRPIRRIDFKKDEVEQGVGCRNFSGSGEISYSERTAIFKEKEIRLPRIALQEDKFSVLSVASEERWIEVDLSEQKLKAWEGGNQFLETPVSSGLPWWPTPTGEFRIWIKLRATKMEGGTGRNYYYLPNVPYVMYFGNDKIPGWRGYGLHGTYWHNDFGNPRSHGCVNLPTPVARELFYWVGPTITTNKWGVTTSPQNPGTRIVIHD